MDIKNLANKAYHILLSVLAKSLFGDGIPWKVEEVVWPAALRHPPGPLQVGAIYCHKYLIVGQDKRAGVSITVGLTVGY